MLTRKQKQACKKAYKWVGWYDEQMVILCSDPMTQAMGAPIMEFSIDWKNKQRSALGELVNQLPVVDQSTSRLFDMVTVAMFGH